MDISALKAAAQQFLTDAFGGSLNPELQKPAANYVQGLQQRLSDPGGTLQKALEQQLAPFVKSAYWDGMRLDAVTGSSDTRNSINRAKTDAALNMVGPSAVGSVKPIVNEAGDIFLNSTKIGKIKVTNEGNAVRIADIQLNPSFQGKGFGTQVINDVIAKRF